MQLRQRTAYSSCICRTGRGFTLVEVLVTLTIGALLVMSAVTATRALSRARASADRRLERSWAGRQALEAMVAALRNVRRDPIKDQPVLVGHSGGRSSGRDRIDLQIIGDRRCRNDGAESDQYEVSFYLADRPGDNGPVLMCRRDHGLDEFADDGGIATLLAEDIVALSFAYFSGGEWTSEWSPLEAKPPEAVRVTLVAASLPEKPGARPDTLTLSTVVAIHVDVPATEARRGRGDERPTERSAGR